jgi:mono/diheme cytochrome c family protein
MFRTIMTVSVLIAAPVLAQEEVTLKPGPGLETVTAACSGCHTLNYIRMNSVFLTPDQWTAEVTKMRKAYGAPIDDETAAAVTKYLSQTYAAPPKS